MTKPDNTKELREKAADIVFGHDGVSVGAPADAVKMMDSLVSLIEAELTEARKDELKKVGQFVQSHNLNDASKHKWYRYHADRVDELNKGKES